MGPKKTWSANEDAILRDMYADTQTQIIAQQLGRTASSVYQRARNLGLQKSAEFLRSEASGRLRNGMGAASRFKQGHATWNKGMKGLDIGGKETRFKKGQKPVNTWKPIGTERIDKDGLLVRKVADTGDKRSGWKGVHVLVWEQHNGKVPQGHAVVFKSSDKTRIEIDNLECVTRAELMKRNSVHRLPKELVRLVLLRGALNRQINKRIEK